jgi:hypothetical protein
MTKNKSRYAIFFTIIAIAIIVLAKWYFGNGGYKTVHEVSLTHPTHQEVTGKDIRALTDAGTVTAFVKVHHTLPDYYITKRDARKLGWNAVDGDLCEVLPGRAIGGDVFGNRERRLPAARGRVWHEADVNYDCGTRNADRLLYSTDGLIFITKDHYKTFQQQ